VWAVRVSGQVLGLKVQGFGSRDTLGKSLHLRLASLFFLSLSLSLSLYLSVSLSMPFSRACCRSLSLARASSLSLDTCHGFRGKDYRGTSFIKTIGP
jgi:hypothetical protein